MSEDYKLFCKNCSSNVAILSRTSDRQNVQCKCGTFQINSFVELKDFKNRLKELNYEAKKGD